MVSGWKLCISKSSGHWGLGGYETTAWINLLFYLSPKSDTRLHFNKVVAGDEFYGPKKLMTVVGVGSDNPV